MRWALTNPADRELRKLDSDSRQRIVAGIERFIDDAAAGDVVKLAGRQEWRLRVGDWRVRFRYETAEGGERIVLVTRVLRRNEGTYR